MKKGDRENAKLFTAIPQTKKHDPYRRLNEGSYKTAGHEGEECPLRAAMQLMITATSV